MNTTLQDKVHHPLNLVELVVVIEETTYEIARRVNCFKQFFGRLPGEAGLTDAFCFKLASEMLVRFFTALHHIL